MSRPVWRPHLGRQQADSVDASRQLNLGFRLRPPNPPSGPGGSNINQAEVTFHWPTAAGALTTGASDQRTIRFQSAVSGVFVDVTAINGGSFTFSVEKNGSAIPGLTAVVVNANGNSQFGCNPVDLLPNADTLLVNVTSVSSGCGGGPTGIFIRIPLLNPSSTSPA
jgi:hypothetical protein